MPTTSASSRGLQVAALQKEMEEVAAAKVATKAEAAAVAEDWSGRRVRLQADFDNLRARNANQTLEAHSSLQQPSRWFRTSYPYWITWTPSAHIDPARGRQGVGSQCGVR
jgi:hypothetical protein